jgi:hypothetical protein
VPARPDCRVLIGSVVLSEAGIWHGHRMSWRFLLLWAVVIVVLYGAADVVYSSGSPQHAPSGRVSTSGDADQEVIDTPTLETRTLSSEEAAACGIPTDAAAGSRFVCGTEFTADPPAP